MAKQTSAMQKTFDALETRQIWEGFASLGEPNASMRDFVVANITNSYPAVPETLPASQRVKKTGKLYDVHSYWSKKPYLAIERFIKHYTAPGDIVLDPFCGGGSTLQAALGLGRKAIGLELSPSAAHISANTASYVPTTAFADARDRVLEIIDDTVTRAFYTFTVEGKPVVAASFIHSEEIRCAKCLQMFPLILPYSSDVRKECPHCEEPFSTRSRKTVFGEDRIVAVEVRDSITSRRGKLLWLVNHPQLADALCCDAIEKAANQIRTEKCYPVPQRLLNLGGRLNTSGSTTLGRLHDDRSICALVEIKRAIDVIEDGTLRGKFLLAFTGTLKNCSKMYRFHEGGGGSPIGAYYVPPIRKELNPVFSLRDKFASVEGSLNEVAAWPEMRFVVSNQSSCRIDMPSNSVDYVFTDPPYADTMPFGDLNFIWDAWLCPEFLDREGEAIGPDWYTIMSRVFSEVFRVLKPGACCSVCYHDTSEGTWSDLLDIMAQAGFRALIGKDVLYIETTQRAYQQTVADKVVKRDHVVNFAKPLEQRIRLDEGGNERTSTDVSDLTRSVIRDFLESHPASTKDRVYDEVVGRMFREGEMETGRFEELLREVAEEVREAGQSSRWYLSDNDVGVRDIAEEKREEAVAGHLEEFINEYRTAHPEAEGVHYSDLFERYLLVKDKPRRLVADWLPEYFFKTADGTWRPPDDEKEIQQKAALREAGTLRRMKRFANSLIEGAPEREQDRPANDRSLAEWIRQCRRAGLYEQGRALYEKGDLNLDNLSDEEQIEVEDDYGICVKRRSNDEKKSKGRKKKKKT